MISGEIVFPATATRAALIRRLTPGQVKAQENLIPPPPSQIYLPERHRNAFDWNSSIVVGMRGAGKSLWTAALTSTQLRRIMAETWKNNLLADLDVHVSFGQSSEQDRFPPPDVLTQLSAQIEARLIWKTVAVKKAAEALEHGFVRLTSWRERVAWVFSEPEEANRILSDFERFLLNKSRRCIFVFDSLDSPSSDWHITRRLMKGALQFALSLRVTSTLRAKIFLRPDNFEDPEIWTFPDSSKLKQSLAELRWSPSDLYGLIIQLITNDAENGPQIRKGLGRLIEDRGERGFIISDRMTRDESSIQSAIESIAGPYMGSDPRRGRTYTWIPNHLADAKGRVSPRSILLAFGEAAGKTEEQFGNHAHALHYRAINDGVTKASATRVDELAEDHPWIQPLLAALRGLSVPCDPQDLIGRWDTTTIHEMSEAGKLPPRKYTTDPVRRGNVALLIEDLEELAVLYRTAGGRVNVPDIFRVSAGMKRRGGVPVAK